MKVLRKEEESEYQKSVREILEEGTENFCLGKRETFKGNYKKALKYFEESAKAVYEIFDEDHLRYGESLREIGYNLNLVGNYKESLKKY